MEKISPREEIEILNELGLTNASIASKVGCHRTAISRAKKGLTTPKLDVALKIHSLYRQRIVSVKKMLEGVND